MSYTADAVNIAKRVGKAALLVLPVIKKYDPGEVVDARALANIGMPREGAVPRENLRDFAGLEQQKIADKLAAKILADPANAWAAQVTQDELAQALRELCSRGTLAHEGGKVEDAEVTKTETLTAMFEEVYNVPYSREDLLLESVMKHVVKAVRETNSFASGKETGVRKCWERYPLAGTRDTKQIEMRSFKVDTDTSAMYAGQAEVIDNTDLTKMDKGLGLWFRLLSAHALAAMGLEVPEGFSHEGWGKLGDKMVMCHLRDVLLLKASYTKLVHFQQDPRAVLVHIDTCIDLLRRYTSEDTPKKTLGAAMFQVLLLPPPL